ncbi:DUF1592 domain-containing protein [Stieleria marina]|uniref:DUF1592 domain-containing protein n=1 Tax=Stieleria marina TaxID=1930275 RepID=UPI003AF3365B
MRSGWAQPGMEKDPLSFDAQIRSIVRYNCYGCHNDDEASGEVNLARDENPGLLRKHRKTWIKVREVVESREMPPDDELSDDKREKLIAYLDKTLDQIDCESFANPYTTTARRLTRIEYEQTVRRLTGLDLMLTEDFSPDPVSFGFAGLGATVGISEVQVEQYADAAKRITTALQESRETESRAFDNWFGQRLRHHSKTDLEAKQQTQHAERVLRKFASEAFRRPVDESYLQSLMRVYDVARRQEQDEVAAIAAAMRGVLMSPRFFMRIEQSRVDAPEAYPVDDFDLATRLSFFLWSGPPDSVLLKLAGEGRINDERVLRKQVRRMLRDERVVEGLVANFFGQWLQLNHIDQHTVNVDRYPGFDQALRTAISGEPRRVLTEMVRKDLPVITLIDAKFTYVNQRLAKHYGYPFSEESDSEGFVRIATPDRRRGGLLTTAALLMLTSDPGRTNVPRRGNFVAGTYFGDPPPPPPPGVPELGEQADSGDRPLRELLEEHRKNPACASCHAKMDPLGFALENFDATGRWRTEDAGANIDASGELSSGETFAGVIELKDVLLRNKSKLIRHMTERMLVYALGRSLQTQDECVVRDAVSAADSHGDRLSAIVETIVLSFAFRNRFETSW